MASTAAAASSPGDNAAEGKVSLVRLHVLRAMYLVLVVGLGAMILPEIVSHALTSRGVIPSLLGAVWLLAFLGLEWDESCLAFERSANPVKTASVWQVREPLHGRSSGRWRGGPSGSVRRESWPGGAA